MADEQTAAVPDRGRRDGRTRRAGAGRGRSAAARGVEVTFAGSPDRVEARLVPERGYEFDAFAHLRASRAVRAPAPARRSRRAPRRPSPACGSSRAAGPTSCSAAAATSRGRWCSPRGSRGFPCALTEADAHLGLANRLAAPFADARLPRLPGRPATGDKYRARRPADPASRRGRWQRDEARRRLGLPADGTRRARLRRLARRAAAERPGARGLGRGEARRAPPLRRARLRGAARDA